MNEGDNYVTWSAWGNLSVGPVLILDIRTGFLEFFPYGGIFCSTLMQREEGIGLASNLYIWVWCLSKEYLTPSDDFMVVGWEGSEGVKEGEKDGDWHGM